MSWKGECTTCDALVFSSQGHSLQFYGESAPKYLMVDVPLKRP